jgi:hypothetical protein
MGDRRRNSTRHTGTCRSHQSISRLGQKRIGKAAVKGSTTRPESRRRLSSNVASFGKSAFVALRGADSVEELLAQAKRNRCQLLVSVDPLYCMAGRRRRTGPSDFRERELFRNIYSVQSESLDVALPATGVCLSVKAQLDKPQENQIIRFYDN